MVALLALLIVSLIRVGSAADQAARQAVVKTLRLIESNIRANNERLKTWSAKGEMTSGQRGREGEAPWIETKLRTHFECDLSGDRLFTIYETFESPPPLEGRTESGARTFAVYDVDQRHVIVGDAWIKADPAPEPDAKTGPQFQRGPGVNLAVRRSRRGENLRLNDWMVVDPRGFAIESGSQTFADGLKLSADYMSTGKDLPVTIRKQSTAEGDALTLRQEYRMGDSPTEPPLVVESTFDSVFGYQPTRLVMTSPRGFIQLEREWSYEKVSGVFVPFSYREVRYVGDESLARTLSREFAFDEIHINEPIDDVWFTWSRLGLIEGDQIQDAIAGTVYRFSEGKPVPADE